MKILGIETTTKILSLGLYDDGKIYEYNLEVGKRLSSLIAVTIKRILDNLSWNVKEIDYFVCSIGPGSFTGLRIGLATVKGFAWALNKPVLGISSLDILAKNVTVEDGKVIIPVIDAKRNLVYTTIFRNKDGVQKRIMPYMLLPLDDFLKKAKPGSIIFGDAADLYKKEIIKNIKGVTILDRDYWYPRGSSIIALALERIKGMNSPLKRKKMVNSGFNIKPIYLYPKECQIKNAKIKIQNAK